LTKLFPMLNVRHCQNEKQFHFLVLAGVKCGQD
jgi:hypothetical protein